MAVTLAQQLYAGPGDSRAPADPATVLEALDCLRVAVAVFDAGTHLRYLNRHYGYLFRAMPPAATLIGKRYEELVRVELAGGEIAPACWAKDEDGYVAQRLAQLRINDHQPRDIRLADGRIIEIKAREIPSGGWIVLWSDATSARNAYNRLVTAVELSADAFALWDKNDRLALCNQAFAHLHGSASAEKLVGIGFADMIDSVLQRGLVVLDCTADAWREKRLVTHRADAGALTVTMANGKAYLVRERTTGDGGRATVYTDVTDQQRAETALAEVRDALDKSAARAHWQANYLADLTKRLDAAEQGAAQAKTTFLRTMSHELKTPLNAIIGFSDLLRTAPGHFSPEQIGEYAGLIHLAGTNLLRMQNQILDLTKIAAGRYPLKRAPVPVASMLYGASDTVCERAEQKTISLRVKAPPADLCADADENALSAMVCQLAENAVAFTQNGGTVMLSATRAGERVRIVVADNGPGVAAEDLQRILEPFEQVGQGIAGSARGSGLGLPLVAALAELHGGTLTIDSAHGEGFTATLDLPAAR